MLNYSVAELRDKKGNKQLSYFAICLNCCIRLIVIVFRLIEIIPSCSISANARANEGRVTPNRSAISC